MTETREDLVNQAMHLVAWQARRFRRLPPGINIEDLESAGGEALIEAANCYDPTMGPWLIRAQSYVRNRMRDTIRAARRHMHLQLQPEIDGEALPPPADTKASDPSELASVREAVFGRNSCRVDRLKAAMPTPAEVAGQVARLRCAMFQAVSEADIAETMQAMVAKAKGGDVRAARLLTELLAPGRSGVHVSQQTVVIQHGDLD